MMLSTKLTGKCGLARRADPLKNNNHDVRAFVKRTDQMCMKVGSASRRQIQNRRDHRTRAQSNTRTRGHFEQG